MRITSVELHPASDADPIVLSFRDPKRLNSYNVKGIIGLDADEIFPKYYGASGNSNDKFYSLSVQKRDIVILIELNPNFSEFESFSGLRDNIYKMVSSTRTGLIEVEFKEDDDVIASVKGFITKFESPSFTKTPELQLTIKCNEAMLSDPVSTAISLAGTDPLHTVIQDDVSTAPHGFQFSLSVVSPIVSFVMWDPRDVSWIFSTYIGGGFIVDDTLHFSSELNNKYIYMVRSGVTTHLANLIAPNSVWPLIFPGRNEFTFTDAHDFSWISASHHYTYWGV